jgi:pilus assembly protein FimV
LGLGDIEVDSALNEKFVGQIELVDVGDLQSSEILVSMASTEDFARVGVERFYYLTDLNFEVVTGSSGAVVNVSSSKAIAEPYLNFIVEVHWPSGRLLKEFTVLLDPPTFGQAAAPAVTAPSQSSESATAGRVQREAPAPAAEQSGTRVTLAPRPSSSPAPARPPSPDGTVMTTRDDTLWKIANRTVPSESITLNQQMLAIQRLNRQAFIRDNINLLKAGYVLRLPSEAQAREVAPDAANAEVAQQSSDWRTGRSRSDAPAQLEQVAEAAEPELRSQVDATTAQPAQPAAAQAAQGEVRIVANSGQLAQGSGSGTDEAVTQLIEEKDSLNRQVDELTYQLDREKEIATNQVAVKDRQLEVKDQQIAELQEQLKQVQDTLSQQQQNQNQSASAQPEPTPWWSSPMVLGGVIGVLVLILVALLVAMRRNRGAEDAELARTAETYDDPDVFADDSYEEQAAADYDTPADAGDAQDDDEAGQIEPTIGDDELELDEDWESEPEIAAATDVADTEEAEAESEQSQTGDVIGEADIYIAYGRYGQAANLLLTTLNTEPDRYDVRLKLLEVYVESNDRENFALHAEYIVEHCDEEDILMACRELEGRLGENELDAEPATVDESAEAEVQAPGPGGVQEDVSADSQNQADRLDLDGEGTGDEFALELDDLEDVESVTEEEVDEAASADEFQLEFDEEDLASDEQPTTVASGELGGDLGMDFDPERDVADSLVEDSLVEDSLVEDSSVEDEILEVSSELADEAEKSGADELEDLEFDLSDLEESADEADTEDLPVSEDAAVEETLSFDDAAQSRDADQTAAATSEGDEFDFADDASDVNSTKLDLAEAYIDMGDSDGARDILNEVVEEGSPEQQEKAQGMLAKIA